jgi:RNA 2',3'-cyclic 3'-phosphodiesterase
MEAAYPHSAGANVTERCLSVQCVAEKEQRVRLFVGLGLPEPMRSAIASWQEGFDDPALRPVRAESLHMTLVFLGSRPAADVERIAGAAFSAVDSPAPVIEIEPEPVALPPARPRLYALGARSEGAVGLHAQVERGLVAAGLHEAEERPFWPHVTVARVRSAKRGGRRPARMERPPDPIERTYVCRPTPLVRLTLFRSLTGRGGAVYEPMAELELPTAARQRGE